MNFLEKLLQCARSNSSLLCIGLDPDPELMPLTEMIQYDKEFLDLWWDREYPVHAYRRSFRERAPMVDIAKFNRAIVEATSDLVCAYKINHAFYEAFGFLGFLALEQTINLVPQSIPIIGDAKPGDVSNTARTYAKALFRTFGFDAVTVNPYVGRDSVEPFMEYKEKGVFILCRTSNVGSADFQALPLSGTGTPLFEIVAQRAREWNRHGNVGLVMGATYPQELRRVRQLCPEMPLLIPGIGAQGGDLASAVRYGVDAQGEKAIISSSRQILYASRGGDFAAAAREAALKLRQEINLYLLCRGEAA